MYPHVCIIHIHIGYSVGKENINKYPRLLKMYVHSNLKSLKRGSPTIAMNKDCHCVTWKMQELRYFIAILQHKFSLCCNKNTMQPIQRSLKYFYKPEFSRSPSNGKIFKENSEINIGPSQKKSHNCFSYCI